MNKMKVLEEGGFAIIKRTPPGLDSFTWRKGKPVKVLDIEVNGTVEVEDGAANKAKINCHDLEQVDVPSVGDSLKKIHHYLTRKRTEKGWTMQVIYGDLPDEVMALSIAESLEGHADMMAELERLRALFDEVTA